MGLLLLVRAEEVVTWTKYGAFSVIFRENSGIFPCLPSREESAFQTAA